MVRASCFVLALRVEMTCNLPGGRRSKYSRICWKVVVGGGGAGRFEVMSLTIREPERLAKQKYEFFSNFGP